MARLYADEDFPFPVVERLRQLGHDVVTTFESAYIAWDIAELTFSLHDSLNC